MDIYISNSAFSVSNQTTTISNINTVMICVKTQKRLIVSVFRSCGKKLQNVILQNKGTKEILEHQTFISVQTTLKKNFRKLCCCQTSNLRLEGLLFCYSLFLCKPCFLFLAYFCGSVTPPHWCIGQLLWGIWLFSSFVMWMKILSEMLLFTDEKSVKKKQKKPKLFPCKQGLRFSAFSAFVWKTFYEFRKKITYLTHNIEQWIQS